MGLFAKEARNKNSQQINNNKLALSLYFENITKEEEQEEEKQQKAQLKLQLDESSLPSPSFGCNLALDGRNRR